MGLWQVTIYQYFNGTQLTILVGGATKTAKRKAANEGPPQPFAKKNRDYLAPESKPLYFDLKKAFKKAAQWRAHQLFASNCATTGHAPRSLLWNPLPPWALSNPQLNTRWAGTTTRAQRELCATLAEDSGIRVNQAEETIKTLLVDLLQIVDKNDLDEITAELQSHIKIIKPSTIDTKKPLIHQNTTSRLLHVNPTKQKRTRCVKYYLL